MSEIWLSSQLVMTVLSHPTGATFVLCVVNVTCNTVPCIHCHRQMTSLFRNNQYARCHNFDVSRFTVILEMLMARDGVIGLQPFFNDEIDFIINDICTQ